MKFVSAFVVGALICSLCCIQSSSGGPITSFVKNAIEKGLSPKQAVIDAVKHKYDEIFQKKQSPHTGALNTELWDAIMGNLDLDDLVTMAKLNPNFRRMATDLFRRKYANIVIDQYFLHRYSLPVELLKYGLIKWGYMEKEEQEKRPSHKIQEDHIIVFDYDLILDTFEYLGDGIVSVKLLGRSYEKNHREMEDVCAAINKNLCDSLQELTLVSISGEMMHKLTGPFTKVKNLTFHSNAFDFDDESARVNRSFPVVRELSLELNYFDDNYFVCHLPLLNELTINSYFGQMPFYAMELMQHNPQIQVVNTAGYPELLTGAEYYLPNIQNLTLWYLLLEKEAFQLKSVTTFTMQDVSSTPNNLTFPRLTELNANFTGGLYFDDWVHFFGVHKKIQRLNLAYSNITNEQFDRLAVHLTSVQEMQLNPSNVPTISVDAIVKFLQNNQQLTKFYLIGCTDNDKEIVHAKLWSQWAIGNYQNRLFMKRRL